MTVAFIEEVEKEESVPVTLSFASGERVVFRLPVSTAGDLLHAYVNSTAKSKKRVVYAVSTGVLSFDLTHVSKIEVGTKSKDILARIK